MPPKTSFAKYLVKCRKAAGLSMDALAEKVGTSKSNIHYWESGEWVPGAVQLEPLAQALGVSYEDLFARAGHDRAELPQPEPYLRVKFPGISDKKLSEAKRMFDQIEAAERRAKKGRRS
jgi:transcriptional regulator with XRE-family HTH domain